MLEHIDVDHVSQPLSTNVITAPPSSFAHGPLRSLQCVAVCQSVRVEPEDMQVNSVGPGLTNQHWPAWPRQSASFSSM